MIRRGWPATIFLILILWGSGAGSATAAKAPEKGPKLDAKAWIVVDARTGQPLAGKAVNRHLAMASTTKMMTAYLAAKKLPFGKRVKAADYQGDPAESLMGLSLIHI